MSRYIPLGASAHFICLKSPFFSRVMKCEDMKFPFEFIFLERGILFFYMIVMITKNYFYMVIKINVNFILMEGYFYGTFIYR
jgi:hypothetical protein